MSCTAHGFDGEVLDEGVMSAWLASHEEAMCTLREDIPNTCSALSRFVLNVKTVAGILKIGIKRGDGLDSGA